MVDKGMSIKIEGTVDDHRQDAKPTFFGPSHPHGLSDIHYGGHATTPMFIPPINTDITFTLPEYDVTSHPGLSDVTNIPDEFNWHTVTDDDSDEILKKKALIATPGNQALCGSCWAISGAGIISDNFVVSGLVTWKPNLSTTWLLACNRQQQCSGGNPQKVFEYVAQNGIGTNHCVDYSWCMEDPQCSGSALKHFDTKNAKEKHLPTAAELNKKIPTCGCYSSDGDHLIYVIDSNISQMAVQPEQTDIEGCEIHTDSATVAKYEKQVKANAADIRKHIYVKGPVMGAFIVFKNFMDGNFTKSEGEVYLERGVYSSDGSVTFSDEQATGKNFKGGHAVAVIGWGVAKNILVDNGGKRADVPYWYARNSWKTTWGSDGGYFKMAMYPWNKISCFDIQARVQQSVGESGAGKCIPSGGFVMISVSKKPFKQKNLDQIAQHGKLLQPSSYYAGDPETPEKVSPSESKFFPNVDWVNIIWAIAPVVVIIFVLWMVHRQRSTNRSMGNTLSLTTMQN